MSSILLISEIGSCVPLMIRMSREGHVCKVHLLKDHKDLLKGFKNPSVLGAAKMLEQYDIIIFDSPSTGAWADELRKDHFVFGGGLLNDSLETKEYAEKVVNLLTNMRLEPSEGSNPIMITGWFNSKEFSLVNYSINYDRLMEGNIGPKCGCMGCITWVGSLLDELARSTLLPMQPLLAKANYLGPISVECLATPTSVHFIRFLPRIGHDATYALMELMKMQMFEFLWKQANQGTRFHLREEYAASVTLGFPPFPNKDPEALSSARGVKVLNIPEPAWRHLTLSDVMMNGEGPCIAGVSGVLGTVTARGKSIQEVRRRSYRTISMIVESKDVMYRKDIGVGVEKTISDLKEWGWINA